MIYEVPDPDAPLTQGDIIDGCPLVFWITHRDKDGNLIRSSATSNERVLVLTQSCDLANTKTSKVQVAVVHNTAWLVDERILKAQTVRDQVRRHRVFGWYFLPAHEANAESIVDLRDIHTVPREILEQQIQSGSRKAAVATPYREHLAQQFTLTYSRIALPHPYGTEPE
jgi:hypothetical protein